MQTFRFSPIKDRTQLFRAIEYIHFESFKLCKQTLGEYLAVAGNIGVFCHFEEEFERLTEMRKEMTDTNINWNQKYYKLHSPIVIPARDDIPETTYTYLYIRKPDLLHDDVGDLDFFMEPNKYRELKQTLADGRVIKGVKIFERPDLDLIKLSDPDVDVSAFVGWKTMGEEIISY